MKNDHLSRLTFKVWNWGLWSLCFSIICSLSSNFAGTIHIYALSSESFRTVVHLQAVVVVNCLGGIGFSNLWLHATKEVHPNGLSSIPNVRWKKCSLHWSDSTEWERVLWLLRHKSQQGLFVPFAYICVFLCVFVEWQHYNQPNIKPGFVVKIPWCVYLVSESVLIFSKSFLAWWLDVLSHPSWNFFFTTPHKNIVTSDECWIFQQTPGTADQWIIDSNA